MFWILKRIEKGFRLRNLVENTDCFLWKMRNDLQGRTKSHRVVYQGAGPGLNEGTVNSTSLDVSIAMKQ